MIPDYLPTLQQGSHSPGSGRACVMEYVSVLAGETWSDSPSCTDPMIASMARNLNDSMYTPQERLALIPLVGRLLEARFPSHRSDLQMAFYRFAERHLSKRLPRCSFPSPEHIGLYLVIPTTWMPAEAIDNLTLMLDRMDAMLGRPAADQPSRERLAAATATAQGPRGKAAMDSAYASIMGKSQSPTFGWTYEGEAKPTVWYDEVVSMDAAMFKAIFVDPAMTDKVSAHSKFAFTLPAIIK